MKKGFTILELLVASLLLGMLVTILTMIFNQSSIAWRTGVAGVADLDEVRDNMAEVREEADNAYIWNNEIHRVLGLWNDDGDLRTRAIDAEGGDFKPYETAQLLQAKASGIAKQQLKPRDLGLLTVGNGDGGGGIDTYTVNVMCLGPDKEFDTWDDIWSYPDDFE